MKCLYCGAELPEGSRFCSSCGNSISGNNVRQCPHCGKPAAENELICSACGTSLTGNVTEPARRNYSSPVKKTNKGVIAVIIVAAVIVFAAAVAVGFTYINTSNDDEEKSSEATQTPAVQQTPTASPQQNVTTALPAGAIYIGSEGQPPVEPTSAPHQESPVATVYTESKQSTYENSIISNRTDDEIEEYISSYVRPLYKSINNNLNDYTKSQLNGVTIWYDSKGCIKKSFERGVNGYNMAREYYYDTDSGRIAFAFIFDESSEYRLYFRTNQLVRYIGPDENVINNPTSEAMLDLGRYVLSEAY